MKQTLLAASSLEPRSIRNCTAGKLPLYEAQFNEVSPSCKPSSITLCTARGSLLLVRAFRFIRLAMLVGSLSAKGYLRYFVVRLLLLKRTQQSIVHRAFAIASDTQLRKEQSETRCIGVLLRKHGCSGNRSGRLHSSLAHINKLNL